MKKGPALSKIIKGSKNPKGKRRKWVEIKEDWYDDFEFGDRVAITKI